jgi:flagellar motor switch protein FliM
VDIAAEIDQVASRLSLVLPSPIISSIESKVARTASPAPSQVSREDRVWQELIEYHVSSAGITVDAVLQAEEITLEKARNLRSGDIIFINENAFNSVQLEAEGLTVYYGSLGKQGQILTVKIKNNSLLL